MGYLVDAAPRAQLFPRDQSPRWAAFHASQQNPGVSCVMVSRGDLHILRHSINCFLRQTYRNRELLIILPTVSSELQAYLESIGSGASHIAIHTVPASLKLGDLRNMAIARAQGSVICTWDDDDLHDARYLDIMVGFMEANAVGAAFLDQLTMWWPRRRQFALSRLRIWEGSMVARRSLIPIYSALDKGEDTPIAEAVVKSRDLVVVHAPQLYVYTVTGQNTSGDDHLERITTGRGAARCADGEYDQLFDRLNALYHVADYQSYCLGAGADPPT